MEAYKIGAVLTSHSSLRDGSLKFTFVTAREIKSPESIENASKFLNLLNSEGWLIFAPGDAQEVEIPQGPPSEFKSRKTPSERLRNVLFVRWRENGEKGNFEDFRTREMERIIDHEKSFLPKT